MRRPWRRVGKIAIQTIVVGAATAIGGAASIPLMMQRESEPTAPMASSSRDLAMLSSESMTSADMAGDASMPASDGLDAFGALSASPDDTQSTHKETGDPSDIGARKVEYVRVFYATDRQLYHASNPHLWITAIVPGVLCGLITCILIAGCFAGRRRWAWGLATCVGMVFSLIVGGQSIIKVTQLVRLAKDGSDWYGNTRCISLMDYPLHLGTSDVSLPPNHRKGTVEQPSVFSFEFQEREDRHVMIQHIETLDADEFYSELTDRIASTADRSALVYIHGYNVQFDDALRRTAQLAKDIDFQGAPILYSWPSSGQLLNYQRDEGNVEWSVAHLERFLADVHQQTGVRQLHVIAHSMGNRALVGALQLLQLHYPEQQPMLSQVILAAPDVDADEFRDRYARAVNTVARRATLYASANDRALLASFQLHGHRRLGLTMMPQPTVAGVDLVDVTPVDTSLLGHSYYGSHPLMIRELMSLVHQGSPPEERNWLTTLKDQQVPPLWRFVPELAAQAGSANY